MKKSICILLAIALTLGALPAFGAIYETYGTTAAPLLEKCTNAIYLGVLCGTDKTRMLYKIGSDDLDDYISIMNESGYTAEVSGDTIYFKKRGSLSSELQDVSLTYLSDKDEYALEVADAFSKSYGVLVSTVGVIDPASIYTYASRLSYVGVQNIYYYSMRKDDIASYLQSMQNKGYKLLSESEREWVLRSPTEALSVRTLGDGKYSSIIMALTAVSVKSHETDSDANDAALNKSKFAASYYEGNHGVLDSELATNSVYILKVYAPEDRCAYITADRLAEFKSVGWYETVEEMSRAGNVKMYSANGREIYVPADRVEDYRAVGWDMEPAVTMYSLDGRELSVLPKDIELYKSLGWYENPPVEMVPADESDERVISVPEESVAAYEAVGWVVKEETSVQ